MSPVLQYSSLLEDGTHLIGSLDAEWEGRKNHHRCEVGDNDKNRDCDDGNGDSGDGGGCDGGGDGGSGDGGGGNGGDGGDGGNSDGVSGDVGWDGDGNDDSGNRGCDGT